MYSSAFLLVSGGPVFSFTGYRPLIKQDLRAAYRVGLRPATRCDGGHPEYPKLYYHLNPNRYLSSLAHNITPCSSGHEGFPAGARGLCAHTNRSSLLQNICYKSPHSHNQSLSPRHLLTSKVLLITPIFLLSKQICVSPSSPPSS